MSDDEYDPIQLLSETLLHKGWGTTLPPSVVALFDTLLSDGPHVREAIDARIAGSTSFAAGLDSPVWEPVEVWTDEEIARIDQRFGRSSEGHESAFQRNQAEMLQRQIDAATLDRYFAARCLPNTHTLGGLLELLFACQVVTIDASGEYSMNRYAPRPAEVLPVDVDEVQPRLAAN